MEKNIKILAFDTTTDKCLVGIFKYGNIYSIIKKCNKKHNEYILPIINEILYKSNIKIKDLNAIIFGKGPGSYTGIRISKMIAEGLSFNLNLLTIGISNLELLAEKEFKKSKIRNILPSLNLNYNKIYWAKYKLNSKDIWNGLNTEQVSKVINLKSSTYKFKGTWIKIGKPWLTNKNLFNKKNILLSSNDYSLKIEDMLELGYKKLKIILK